MDDFLSTVILVLVIVGVIGVAIFVVFTQARKSFRETKNYERGLKMIPLIIHLPPPSDDIEAGQRDARDVADETISQAQVMYNIISSTAVSGFKSKFYGQRHISLELVATGGLIHYYVVVPMVLLDAVKQAVAAAYPAARLEEVEENNLFSSVGKTAGTIGGEFNLKTEYAWPIATYQESKRDAMRAILNALSTASREDGVGIQLLLRPAPNGWTKRIERITENIRKGRKAKSGSFAGGGAFGKTVGDLMEALWKPPEASIKKDQEEQKPLSGIEQAKIEALEEKAKYAGYEVLVRVVASSSTAARSQVLLQNVVSAFALFDSPTHNGFRFTPTRNIEAFVTSYIFRFFPPEVKSNILNTVEVATLFHLPDQSNIPTSMVKRETAKQVDGPTEVLDEGFLIGYNMFRGVKKPIRLSDTDRRRHFYFIGQTGTGKSGLLHNLTLQDMLDGKGFAVVDPHGDLVEEILSMVPKERVEDVIYFDPGNMDSPIGLNLFEIEPEDPDPERTKDYIISEVMNMLYSLYDPGHTGIVGPRMENIVRNAALLLMDAPDGGTFMDNPYVLTDPEQMKSRLPYLKNQRALTFWTKEWPAAQRSNDSGEVTSWVVSKWASFETALMSNILGQLKSGFRIRDIMDNKKILLVNLSKGKMGELPSKLLGMIFVMKFQAAAMSRANVPEEQRQDFTLYVDEFQNFATDSFESILSEARKYRLSLVVVNQFMTQLTDKIREAIIGNVGTVVCGRIGSTDAELMVKRFTPVFDAEDLMKLPNFKSITSVLIKGTPSSPFSMDLLPPMGHGNKQLADAMKRLSAAKYGRDRREVEMEIHKRLKGAEEAREAEKQKRLEAMRNSNIPTARPINGGQMPPNPMGGPTPMTPPAPMPAPSGGSSFLDDWLAKRQKIKTGAPRAQPTPPATVSPIPNPTPPSAPPVMAPPVASAAVPVENVSPVTPNAPMTPPINQPAATEPTPAPVTPPTKDKAVEAENQLEKAVDEAKTEVAEKRSIQREANELTTADDGVNEIFIDLRGRVHDGND